MPHINCYGLRGLMAHVILLGALGGYIDTQNIPCTEAVDYLVCTNTHTHTHTHTSG